jgi:glycosyltransferase involved in cell wall biosynthesis
MVARILGAMGLAPLVLSTIHNIYEGGAHRDFAYRVTGWLSAHITAVSEAIAERCVRTKAVAPSRYSVLKNGIDTKSFSPSRFPGRVETEHVEHQFVWLAAGRDVPAKDFDSLLAAFQIVRAAIPDAQLQIAGKPASHRGISLNEAGVCWMGLSTDMPRTIFHCDAFVLSSAWEGMPLVIGEAMAMEKPVVATDVGGVREMVGQAAVLIRPKDPQALAEAMLRIMRMREPERRAMGSAARERILQYFDMDMKADEWESLYARLFRNERDSAFIRADLGACE